MDLVIATHNAGKLREYQHLLAEVDFNITGLQEIGLGTVNVEETGDTFVANAALKAEAYARASGRIALADDSGLVVHALDGAPGVYSARYGGEGLDDAGRRNYLLEQMQHIKPEERSAHFACVIAIHDPRSGRTLAVEGQCHGHILTEERDAGYGFGYDALFVPDGHTRSFAQMPPDEKNAISHRAMAAAKVPPLLAELRGDGG